MQHILSTTVFTLDTCGCHPSPLFTGLHFVPIDDSCAALDAVLTNKVNMSSEFIRYFLMVDNDEVLACLGFPLKNVKSLNPDTLSINGNCIFLECKYRSIESPLLVSDFNKLNTKFQGKPVQVKFSSIITALKRSKVLNMGIICSNGTITSKKKFDGVKKYDSCDFYAAMSRMPACIFENGQLDTKWEQFCNVFIDTFPLEMYQECHITSLPVPEQVLPVHEEEKDEEDDSISPFKVKLSRIAKQAISSFDLATKKKFEEKVKDDIEDMVNKISCMVSDFSVSSADSVDFLCTPKNCKKRQRK